MRKRMCRWLIKKDKRRLARKLFPDLFWEVRAEMITEMLSKLTNDWYVKENLGGS